MTKRTRQAHAPAFKAKVALAAVKREDAGRVAQQYDVHLNQITAWKAQLIEDVAEVFAAGSGGAEAAPAVPTRSSSLRIVSLSAERDIRSSLAAATKLPCSIMQRRARRSG